MMTVIKKLILLRRQNDIVKIILLFMLVGITAFGLAVHKGIKLYHISGQPTCYVLSYAGEDIPQRILDKVKNIGGVDMVSGVISDTLSFTYKGVDMSLQYDILSKEYIEKIYGIINNSSMPVFYMNDAAYNLFRQNSGEGVRIDDRDMQIIYKNEGGEEITGRLVVTDKADDEMGDSVYVFCAATGTELSEGESRLRVHCAGYDLTDNTTKEFSMCGMMPENESDILKTEYEVKVLLNDIHYIAFIILLSVITQITLISIFKASVR